MESDTWRGGGMSQEMSLVHYIQPNIGIVSRHISFPFHFQFSFPVSYCFHEPQFMQYNCHETFQFQVPGLFWHLFQ